MLAHKTSGGTKLTEKDKKDEDDEPMKPEEISVMVINSSGIDGAGAESPRPAAQGLHHLGRGDGQDELESDDDHHDFDAQYGCLLRHAVCLRHP